LNRSVRRLQTILPGLVGLALATTILWKGGEALEREAEGHEPFALHVDQPAPILALGPEGFDAPPTWRALVTPREERARVGVSIDGFDVVPGGAVETGALELDLAGLVHAPGWHFVEVEVARRGGRRDHAVDPILVGRFAGGEQTPARRCAATFTASPALISSLVEPLLRERLLPALRANDHMGPETEISAAELELRDDVIEFSIVLEGVNTLAVSGVVLVAIVDERKLHTELVTLGEVDFRGELRNTARGIGAGGGALVGGLIAGPLAPLGAAAGYWAADKLVSRKARETVYEQVEAGLGELEGFELLPTHIELVPGRPRSQVAIGFCDKTGVRETGLVAGLWIEPAPVLADDAPRFDLHTPGPLVVGATPTIDPLAANEDLRVELSIDAVNALIYSWTETGMLAALIGERRSLERANEELEAWTPLRLRALVPTRPPTFTPIGGPDEGWRYGLGGLALEVEGVDAEPWGEIQVAAAGSLSPRWDGEAGELSLVGSLDRLDLTCVHPSTSAEDQAEIEGCFGDVLDAAEVRARIDERLRPGAENLPSFALAEILDERLDLALEELGLSRPRPGVLRLSAAAKPAKR